MMNTLYPIIGSLGNELMKIQSEGHTSIVAAKRSVYRVRECCKDLSIWLLSNQIASLEDEIFFFKEIKVIIYSNLYYFTDLLNIESSKPAWDFKAQKKYLKDHLYRIAEHINAHRSLYQYHRSGMTEWDHRYFSRIKRYDNKYDIFGNIIQCEDDYSSTHDMLYARVVANDMLEKYLLQELNKLSIAPECYNDDSLSAIGSKGRRLKWTASKAALIELIYAIQAAGSIENGKAEIKEIATAIEVIFRIDLGDFYRTYLEIRNRTNRVKYLEELKSALLNRMDEDDE